MALSYCIAHFSAWEGSSSILPGAPLLGEHSSIPISVPLPGLMLLYVILDSGPPPVRCSSISVSTPHRRYDNLLFHPMLLQYLLCTPLFHTALPIWRSSVLGSWSPFSSEYFILLFKLPLEFPDMKYSHYTLGRYYKSC